VYTSSVVPNLGSIFHILCHGRLTEFLSCVLTYLNAFEINLISMIDVLACILGIGFCYVFLNFVNACNVTVMSLNYLAYQYKIEFGIFCHLLLSVIYLIILIFSSFDLILFLRLFFILLSVLSLLYIFCCSLYI